MAVALITHPDCGAHDMGEIHPESPARLATINDQLISSGLDFVLRQFEAAPIKRDLLTLAHTQQYVDFIFANAPQHGIFQLDPDTLMTPATLQAALLSAGAAVDAVDLVMQGEISAAFCATRPPGHHAERNKAMGFCFFNNIAIAAIYAKQKYALERVAIVDFDVHHGNGTENILSDKSGFLFCSSFQHPFYPFSGTESHPAHIINSPMPATASSIEFRAIVNNHWLPALHEFKPQLLLISAGFDAHAADLMSEVRLFESDYRWVTDQLKIIADQYSHGRIISVLEGGYELTALGRSVVAHINGLIGH